jgi:predicted nucleotidyltransferase
MRIRIPEGSTLFLFGSILKSKAPNDLDILVVYDPEVCAPEFAYQHHRSMLDSLAAAYSLPVHATFLTPSEQRATDFISRTCAVLFSEAQGGLSSRLTDPVRRGFSYGAEGI